MQNSFPKYVAAFFVVGMIVMLGGCSCRPSKPNTSSSVESKTIEEMRAQREKRKRESEKKLDFEIVDLQVLPSDEPTRNGVRPQSHVKPGHWFGAVQRIKANNFDLPKGDLEAECVDSKLQSLPLPGSFELLTRRGVSLPKGQEKHTDLVLFAPETRMSKFYFVSRLRPRGGGQQLGGQEELAIKMRASENHFVVLAAVADNYQFLKSLRFANPGIEGLQFLNPPVDYHFKLPKGTQRVDLSSQALTWSTISHVVWDDFDPDILSIAQQTALLDWLHWGGQLIINGPRTLDRLSASFLGPYLPAKGGKISKLTDRQFEQLNDAWSFNESREAETSSTKTVDESVVQRRAVTQELSITNEEERPLCVKLQLSDQGHFTDTTGELVAESRVGRGAIRVTAFNIPHPVFRSWTGYDSFLNACLLGRLPRRYEVNSEGTVVESWANTRLQREDPRTISQVRFFSRDATFTGGRRKRKKDSASNTSKGSDGTKNNPSNDAVVTSVTHPLPRDAKQTSGVQGFAYDGSTGVAGWSDKSDVSQIATDSLVESAGVEIPSSKFVGQVLALYLIVVGPLNWLLFRIAGRVEWAWAMIPLISIGGALGVLRAAQLDIGFVRSRTEVAVLEMQPGYDRAHVTRYVGFYTSLSSGYQITGEDDSTLMLPLATEQRTEPDVQLRFGDQVEMDGFRIGSSSTGMIHTEQILNVGGAIRFDPATKTVDNQSTLNLKGVAVVRRISDTELEWAGLGALSSKQKTNLSFEPLRTKNIEFTTWENSPTTSELFVEDSLNIRGLLDLATAPERLGLGETVLVGWSDQLIPGISVSPKASQVVARSVVVVQLQHAKQPLPQRDANSYSVQKTLSELKSKQLQELIEN